MTIHVDFLRISSPTTTPATTRQVELDYTAKSHQQFYRATFDDVPEAVEAIETRYPDITVEGAIGGTFFHLTAPNITLTMWVDGPIELNIRPTTNGYERVGDLEHRAGAWVELPTNEIADSSKVRRWGDHPERDVDMERVGKSRRANYWTPTPPNNETGSPRTDLTELICILPEDTPAEEVAELAASYLDVSEDLLRDAVPGIREKLRNGELSGPELILSDQTVWRYTPDWAESVQTKVE